MALTENEKESFGKGTRLDGGVARFTQILLFRVYEQRRSVISFKEK